MKHKKTSEGFTIVRAAFTANVNGDVVSFIQYLEHINDSPPRPIWAEDPIHACILSSTDLCETIIKKIKPFDNYYGGREIIEYYARPIKREIQTEVIVFSLLEKNNVKISRYELMIL